MNILNEKKEVTPIITPSLGYKLRSINWNEDFYFDNPIDKEKINSIPKAIEISKDIFLAIEKSGMQYRETYKWDEYLYFKMTAENIFAATIYYYCKHYPKEYCNLAYIIATVCNPDISILSEMLKRDRETEIFIRGLNECHTLNVGSEFTGIKNELTTYLGRLYTKEFFYLFTEGKYSPNTSQFILLHYFDNVIWQVEQLQKNGFLFLESNIKKENDEESLYDSYDDGIPIKFLINKGRLDFSKIMYESTEKNETNTMKKIIFLIMISFISLKSMAGDGDKFFNISGGWQWKNTVNAVVGLEFEGKYHNAYELYIDLATAYDKCPVCNKVCSDSFWSYKTFGIGAAYKPTISRGKNSNLRWRFGADLGANRKGFQASIDIGLEYSYSFRNGMQVFVMQKNDFVFWTRDHFRNGLLVGVKFPINK